MGQLKDHIEARAAEALKQNFTVERIQEFCRQLGFPHHRDLTLAELQAFLETPEGKAAVIQGMNNARLEALIDYLDSLINLFPPKVYPDSKVKL